VSCLYAYTIAISTPNMERILHHDHCSQYVSCGVCREARAPTVYGGGSPPPPSILKLVVSYPFVNLKLHEAPPPYLDPTYTSYLLTLIMFGDPKVAQMLG
jgi:hypothetical protein